MRRDDLLADVKAEAQAGVVEANASVAQHQSQRIPTRQGITDSAGQVAFAQDAANT